MAFIKGAERGVFSDMHDFTSSITFSSRPIPQTNSSKSRGLRVMSVSYPTGNDGTFFRLTPRRDPEAMTSYLPSTAKAFSAVLARGQFCISSNINKVDPSSNLNPVRSPLKSMVMWSTLRFPSNADFRSSSMSKFMYTVFL